MNNSYVGPCAYCHVIGPLHQDHVVPRSRGGPDTPHNIVMACAPCNTKKSDRLPSEWLGKLTPAPIAQIESAVSARMSVRSRGQRGPWAANAADRPAYHAETDPFDRWVRITAPHAPSSVVDAAVHVHDTLEVAQRIALSTFGRHHRASDVLAIYEAIERRADLSKGNGE